MASPVLRFERYELQVANRRLLRDGREVPLRARAFDLLVVLAERAGHLVTKDELLDRVWPGLVVEENNIAVQVAALRRALEGPLIVTVPGRGYRFDAHPQSSEATEGPAAGATPIEGASPAPVPAGPRLYGRDTELQHLQSLLQEPGCVTLAGPGGVGKTSLARALAAAWAAQGEPPAAWLDLAALADAAPLGSALYRALGAEAPNGDPTAPAALQRALGAAARLVVLDNAEHLVEAVARLVPALLAAAPALRLLVTSQAPLAVAGERVERIEPLALPAADASDAQALRSAAVALFVDRVHAADARYAFNPASLGTLRRLCAALDGLPLALEMAAARVPLLGLEAVQAALDERFALLRGRARDAPGRHRSLRAALDWSYDLLDAAEQRLFRRLGVFADGFTPELAAAVGGDDGEDPWDTIDRLAVLVDRSLVVGNHADPPRYRLLESARSHALDRLAAADEEVAVRRRFGAVLVDLFRRAEPEPRDDASRRARRLALAELANVREALAWSARHDRPCALQLAVYASIVATFTSWRVEASDWLAACEPRPEDGIAPTWQALWWRHHATQLLFRGSPEATAAARRAVQVCRDAGDALSEFWSLVALVRASASPGIDLSAATGQIQALLASNPQWQPTTRTVAAGTLAQLCLVRGDDEGALRHRLDELEIARRAGLVNTVAAAEYNVAFVLTRLGRRDEALERLQAFLDVHRDDENANVIYARLLRLRLQLDAAPAAAQAEAAALAAACRRHGLLEMAALAPLVALRHGRPRAAAVLLGYLRALIEARGAAAAAPADEDRAQAEEALRERFAPLLLAQLLQRGRTLDAAAADRLLTADADA